MYRWSVCLSITGCRCPVPVQGHRFIAHPSVRASARASVTRPSLLSLTSLSVRPSAARRWSVYWSRGNWPVPGLSARSSLVRLIGSWSLACSSVAGLLFVRHWPWSSICHSYIACLSPRLSCRSFACCSAIGPPLLCLLVRLLVHRWSICYSAGGLSARSSLVHPFGSCHSCVCSSRGRSCVCSGRGHWLARPWLVCCSCVIGHGRRSVIRTSLVRLLDSSLVCRWCVTDLSLTCH